MTKTVKSYFIMICIELTQVIPICIDIVATSPVVLR